MRLGRLEPMLAGSLEVADDADPQLPVNPHTGKTIRTLLFVG